MSYKRIELKATWALAGFVGCPQAASSQGEV